MTAGPKVLTTGRRLRLALVIGATIAAAPSAAFAQETVEPSNVVIVLDYSLSILQDEASRGQFAEALDRIADTVDEKAADLADGNATISFVAFATSAADYDPTCIDLKLSGSEPNVHQLATCFRGVAGEYKAGPDAAVRGRVGNATNYVAAFERAAAHLPPVSRRPAIVFFTDGKHETQQVPSSAVQPAANSLFGARSPFAFLPVGMGLVPDERPQLEAGLLALRDLTRDMPPCPGGATFEWPAVVFETAEAAGEAVSLAVQRVTCGFPALIPTPTAGPAVGPAAPTAVRLTAADRSIEVSWQPPAEAGTSPVERYEVRCRPASAAEWGAEQPAGPEASSLAIDGLDNGTRYVCEVRAVTAAGPGDWAAARATAVPVGPPSAPRGVAAEAGNQAATLRVDLGPDGASAIYDYTVECSSDGGSTWQPAPTAATNGDAISVGGLVNSSNYTCRVYAANSHGVSAASSASNPFTPCGSQFECQPWLLPGIGAVIGAALLALLAGVLVWSRNRARRQITVELDDLGTTYLGLGPSVGASLLRDGRGRVRGLMPGDRRSEIVVRHRGGDQFTVKAAGKSTDVLAGEPATMVDDRGEAHRLVLRHHGATGYDFEPRDPEAGRR